MRTARFIIGLGILCWLCNSSLFAKSPRSLKTHFTNDRTYQARTVKAELKPFPSVQRVSVGSSKLTQTINAIIAGHEGNADIAVYVKSMKYGDILYVRHILHPLTPASTLKVLTAEAALLYLGPKYRFSTQLLTDAKKVSNGILQGNLFVVLSGDPTLTYNDVVALLLTLKRLQIYAISGNVYLDNTAYDQRFYGPGWNQKDKQNCYGAPISASIINHNCLAFKVTPSKQRGHTAQIFRSPQTFYPSIQNSVVTKSHRTRACSLRLSILSNNRIQLAGCLGRGRNPYGFSYVVTDIPQYNRALFKGLLNKLGINVYGQVTFGSAPNHISFIGQHTSEPLHVLVSEMLKKSDNVIAGAIFKKIGQLYTRQPGSWENGSLAVAQILMKYAKLSTTGLRILDGSGLSPNNLLTPAQMMQVLDFAYHHYPTSYEFVSALPIAGVDGTLKHRMSNIARKVRAKTGTISGVISLAGYAVTDNKEPLAFVIMINGSKLLAWHYRELEDQIATALTKYNR